MALHCMFQHNNFNNRNSTPHMIHSAKFSKLSRFIFKLFILIPVIISIFLTIPIVFVSYLASFFNKKLSNTIATFSALLFWTAIGWSFKQSCRIEIPNIPEDDYLVISNHISAADFILINSINKHRFQHSKYAFKKILRFVPVFYQGFIACNYLVLKRSFDRDRESIIRHFQDIKEHRYPMWFILFSEGHRFTSKFKEECDKFCAERGINPFKNVLMPRHKGFSLICDELRGSYVKNVLDLTFYCDREGFSLFSVLFGLETYNIRCDARIVPIEDIKNTEEFIIDAFRRKDSLIESWKNHKCD